MRADPGPVLVTGANGFVGRALCAALGEGGYDVTAAVRDGTRAQGVRGRIVPIGALSRETDWDVALAGVKVVVHLAGRVHVMNETASDPFQAFRAVNVEATQALARAAVRHGVSRLVFVSSIKVNGEATAERAFDAEDNPAPGDPYGVSKLEAERALARIGRETGLEVVVVRPPLVYGPGVGGNFRRLLGLVSRGVPLPFGAIANRRSLIYNQNLASALIACATHPDAKGRTYLVSDDETFSTPELVRRLGAALGRKARLVPIPMALLRAAGAITGKSEEVDRLVGSLTVDSRPIRTQLAWRAPYSAEEGLRQTALWYGRQGQG